MINSYCVDSFSGYRLLARATARWAELGGETWPSGLHSHHPYCIVCLRFSLTSSFFFNIALAIGYFNRCHCHCRYRGYSYHEYSPYYIIVVIIIATIGTIITTMITAIIMCTTIVDPLFVNFAILLPIVPRVGFVPLPICSNWLPSQSMDQMAPWIHMIRGNSLLTLSALAN